MGALGNPRWTAAAIFAAVLVQGGGAGRLAAQTNPDPADSVAVVLARADSVRAILVQPPGSRGFGADDLVRMPFRVFVGAVTLAAAPVVAALKVGKAFHLDEAVRGGYHDLEAADVHVRPAFIGSRSWPALVVRWDGLDPLFVEGGYSLRRYTLLRGGLAFGDTVRGAELSGERRDLTQLHFWGVGMGTRNDDRADFSDVRRLAGAAAWAEVVPHVLLRLDGGYEDDRIGPGEDPSLPDLASVGSPGEFYGLAEAPRYWRGGAGLDVDVTRGTDLRTAGARAMGRWDIYRGADGTDSGFERVLGDLRAYLPLGDQHVLAARLLAEDHFAETGGGVPFYRLATLGDDEGLRGFTGRRFRDKALLATQVEWRYRVWSHPSATAYSLDGFAFVDHGAVGPSLSAVGSFETTPGIGLRLMHRGLAWGEVYAAFGGEESPRFHLSLGSTF